MPNYNIPFSPPAITEAEIAEVADTLRSGWITTGPKTKELERRLSVYTQTPKTVCLNSATGFCSEPCPCYACTASEKLHLTLSSF